MEVVSDLHLHSKYSRAVSPQMTLVNMAAWAKIKGINLLGTGDFTHPKWQEEIKESLEEEEGIFRLREDRGNRENKGKIGIKFLLTGEISSIYKQGGKTRKVHSLIIVPSLTAVEKICKELRNRKCNLNSDGRPIIGLSAKNLLSIVLEADERSILIPAHIWTPWFSMFGDKSGFDSIEECFEDLSKYIYAIETGLSSDPEMNWAIPNLDNRNIVSFSDAHSGKKLGRECTVFEVGELSYERVIRAIRGSRKNKGDEKIKYTIEFYPEEGMYHFTGHRKCEVSFGPEEIRKRGTACPVCGKKMTVGVAERVGTLGKIGKIREIGEKEEDFDEFGVKWIRKSGRPPFARLVPLVEIISESLGVGVGSKKVEGLYFELIEKLGSEIEILLRKKIGPAFVPLSGTMAGKGSKLADGVKKVRAGDIFIKPGFDGKYGVVKVWEDKEDKGNKGEIKEQGVLF